MKGAEYAGLRRAGPTPTPCVAFGRDHASAPCCSRCSLAWHPVASRLSTSSTRSATPSARCKAVDVTVAKDEVASRPALSTTTPASLPRHGRDAGAQADERRPLRRCSTTSPRWPGWPPPRSTTSARPPAGRAPRRPAWSSTTPRSPRSTSTGVAAERELPIIKKIAVGSLRNKLLFILPAALLLSQFLPWLLTPILMVGGTYLCYEGAEKVWERLRGHDDHARAGRRGRRTGRREGAMVAGAIRTDFILSAEIMVIALNEVADEPFLAARDHPGRRRDRASPSLVYGVVALIVKMDDIGLRLTQRSLGVRPAGRARPGHGDAAAARRDLGRRHRRDALGRRPHPAGRRRRARLALRRTTSCTTWRRTSHHALGAVGGVARLAGQHLASAVVGLVVGAVVVVVMHVLPFAARAEATLERHDAAALRHAGASRILSAGGSRL